MPQLARITSTFFVNLINRLGIRPPFSDGFEMSNVVQPVSLVDSDISIPTTVTTPTQDSAFSAGLLTAPGAGTVIADTGAQPAGTYNLIIWVCGSNTAASRDFYLQRRNAANAANIWEQGMFLSVTWGLAKLGVRVTLQTNERVRLITGGAFGASEQVYGNIFIGS